MLGAHFITGDGRGNENIGLTTVHYVFHAEHNRLVEANKATILADGDLAFLNEWLLIDVAEMPTAAADIADLVWDGERLFQAARFVTEMQYQHMVFEEFARRMQINVDPFVFTNSADLDASIVAEFAHVVYRFGHSMLTDTVDRLDAVLNVVGDADASLAGDQQVGLIEAFLNPQMFTQSGSDIEAATGAIIRGMSRQVGNEIDEFVVEALRNNLVGLPLDLAAINIARGRETGSPTLNDARDQMYAMSRDAQVKPYTSWLDFAQNIKNPISVVNFIAAYGTHESIRTATTLDDKRDAAMKLVLGDGNPADGVTIRGITYSNADRLAFLNGSEAYTGSTHASSVGSLGGVNAIDMWIGGLAEKLMEFGGQLGSTFNFVFEYQLEHLQNGDRFYYLSRTQGMNLLNLLEANTFSDIIMRNTDLGDLHAMHLPALSMSVADMILELDTLVAQQDYNGDAEGLDPTWDDPMQTALVGDKVFRQIGTVNGGTDADGHTIMHGGVLKYFGGEHVVLGGTEGNDAIYGDKGIDTLWGDGGNDYLNAGMESDQVYGGEGDDIIEDPFGDDFLRGEAGHDVVISSHGLDFLFGGEGQDFVAAYTDSSEIFAGPGNDFVHGGTSNNFLLGNEGDDWIEGGEGFDIIAGENSELFFNSPIIGHDIMDGQGNDTDYDAENGDDIMVQSAGIQRSNGMDGFDWAIHKGDKNAADSDLGIRAFDARAALILRDRFDSVEGLSGWNNNDTLTGAAKLLAGEGFVDALTQDGVNRITSLRQVLNIADSGVGTDVVFESDTNGGGEIILGGAGSDTIRGNLGNDYIDGDAWLNVRISVREGNDANGPTGDEIFTVNSLMELISGTGIPAWDGKSIAELMRTGVINPGQLQAVREILNSDGQGVDPEGTTNNADDIDVAVFGDVWANYTIEGANAGVGGADIDGDGFISVTHTPPGGGGGGGGRRIEDGTDLIRNIEVLQFVDDRVFLDPTLMNDMASGELAIAVVQPDQGLPGVNVGDTLIVNLGTVADVDGLPADGIDGFIFAWEFEQTPGVGDWAPVTNAFGDAMSGRTLVITADLAVDGFSLRVVGSFRDAEGMPEVVWSTATAPVAPAVVTVATTGPDDPLVGTNGADIIDALAGDDVIFALAGDDIIIGGPGNDFIDGGAGIDTIVFNDAGETLINTVFAVTETGTVDVTFVNSVFVDEFTNVEFLQFGVGNQEQTITSAQADILAGLIRGTAAAETLTGTAADEWFVGHGGNDVISADVGDDSIVWNVGDGMDIVDGGANAVADTMYVNGSQVADVFTIYTRAEALLAGLDVGGANTEIVITRNGERIALLDNVEELVINRGLVGLATVASRGDTVIIVGDFTQTSLALNTITIDGTDGDDVIDISGLASSHRIVLNPSGGNDTIIGTMRPQDVIELAEGELLENCTDVDNGDGTSTLYTTSGSVTYTTPASPADAPSIVEFGQVSHPDTGGGDTTGNGNGDTSGEDTSGEDASGEDTSGEDTSGEDASGEDTSGEDTSGEDISGEDTSGEDTSGEDASGEDTSGEDTSGEDETDTGGDTTNTGGSSTLIQIGTSADDTRVGSAGGDTLTGEDGDDTLLGLDGDDNLLGGAGADYLVGGSGDDLVIGNGGNDYIAAGTGDDTVLAGSGNDTVFADAGNDLVFGEAGRDVVHAGAGDDTIFAAADDGNDVYHGDAGIDTLDLEAISANMIVELGSTGIGSASSDETGTDTLSGIENVLGGSGNDRITGNASANALNGGAGGDILTGGAGGDAIDTGVANDDVVDLVRFSATGDFGDTIINFDVFGGGANADRIEFGGALAATYDDGHTNGDFTFATGNGGTGNAVVMIGQGNDSIEALMLTGAGGEGVANINLSNAGLVAAAFNLEFAITAGNDEDALFVINDTDGDSASVWQWVQAAGGTDEIDASELTLIATIDANATVATSNFDFFQP